MEFSEPERATARFQAVVSSLLEPGRGAQLFVHSPLEVRLQVGMDTQAGVPVLAQVLLAGGDDPAALLQRLQPMLDQLVVSRSGSDERRFYLRIIVVTTLAEAEAMDAALRRLAEGAPAAPALQVFQVSSDGTVRSPSALAFTEVGPALRDQAKRPLTRESQAEFAARCAQAAAQTQIHLGQVRELAQVMQTRRTPVTYALLALNLAVFALTYLWGGADKLETLFRTGALAPQRVLAGDWWRLLSATALHHGVVHLLFNSMALWNLGVLLERLVGSARFLTLYILTGLCGSLVGIALTGQAHAGTSVGASGAICGLLAAGGALGLRPRGDLPAPIAQNLKRMALLNLGLTVIVSLQPQVDWRAHLGGALAGAALTLLGLIRPTVQPGVAGRRPRAHLALAVGCGALLLLSIGAAIYHGLLLAHPEQRQRIALAGTPLSLEVPRCLGQGSPGTTGEGSTVWLFADPLVSPVILIVVAERHPGPLANPAEREQFAQKKWQPYKKGTPGILSERELRIDGLPALEVTGSLSKCERMRGLVQIRRDYTVSLDLCLPANLPERQIPRLADLVATFHDEPR